MKIRRLRKIDVGNINDTMFAFRLRNVNSKAFFNSKQLNWEDHIRWLTKATARPDFDFYIIEWYEQPAGTLAVEHRKDCEFLQNLCVSEWARGHGLARWAITELMKPNRFIIAQVKPENKSVIRMYEELGFWRAR